MLELDMALDADLGIDSIKRVEILSALQERLPDAPAVKPEHLGTLLTLRHIADFLHRGSASNGERREIKHEEREAKTDEVPPAPLNLLVPRPAPLPPRREPVPLAPGA